MGLATPFGDDLEYVWKMLINGNSAIRRIQSFDPSLLGCQIAGEIVVGKGIGEIDLDKYIDSKNQVRYDRFIQLGIVAATQAMNDSGLSRFLEQQRSKSTYEEYDNLMDLYGVIIGSGIGGLSSIEKTVLAMADEKIRNKDRGIAKNPLRNPFFIVGSLTNSVSGCVSNIFGLKGPSQSSATTTGSHAIADAARLIAMGSATVMLAGGSEATICETAMAGLDTMRALSRNNNNPEKASCPWNKSRDGFILGEGSGVLVLEEYEHAMRRGTKIYCEIIGFGTSCDAYHLSAPHPEGNGIMRAMKTALNSAQIDISEIDYINAEGASTASGDLVELRAIKRLFKGNLIALKTLSISSTKSMIGNLLGAAGAVEAIFSIMSINRGQVPPTINLDDPIEFTDDEIEIPKKVTEVFNLTPNIMEKKNIQIAASNSFGFGGSNACLVFKKV